MKVLGCLFVIFLFVSAPSRAQSNSEEERQIEAAVNGDLWQPFKRAFETRDWQLFNSLHTDDVVRVNSWGIRVGEEYKTRIKESYSSSSGVQQVIDFRFELRKYSGDIGYEIGYYRIMNKTSDETVKNHYARFHVALRRVEGQWKISQDWDADQLNGTPVVKEDFERLPEEDL